MKSVFHISTECYPAAKAGGMGDVVGSLPIYLPEHGIRASVVIPKYDNSWFRSQKFTSIYSGTFFMGREQVSFEVLKLKSLGLGFAFYCIAIPGKFDRESIYLGPDGEGYRDEPQRNIAFQTAVLEWLSNTKLKVDGIHCHDHMTALITCFCRFCPAYKKLKDTPTFLTIHNGQYRGLFSWSVEHLLPQFDRSLNGWLDWDGVINSLATGIKCAWTINTVSPSYMQELMAHSDSLTMLYRDNYDKCVGIINGIDNEVWNPATDKLLDIHLKKGNWREFKSKNKGDLLSDHPLDDQKPLVGFIGRMAYQKGADLLSLAIHNTLQQNKDINFYLLGSGDRTIEHELLYLASLYPENVVSTIAYDEALARKIYAGSDYLIMPSRFEPCGLNQMFAMRYGSVPIVTHVGGLIDTVPDVSDDGNGIVIHEVNVHGIEIALKRAAGLFNDQPRYTNLRDKITELDFSWSQSASEYAKIYKSHIK